MDHERPEPNGVTPSPAPAVSGEPRELVRDWEVLFWAFLLFGLGRLVWLYLYHPEHTPFHLGLSCGFVFCGVLGFLMRWVFEPKTSRSPESHKQ